MYSLEPEKKCPCCGRAPLQSGNIYCRNIARNIRNPLLLGFWCFRCVDTHWPSGGLFFFGWRGGFFRYWSPSS